MVIYDEDNPYHEKISYANPLIPLKIFIHKKVDGFWNIWHYHKQIELLYILKGRLDVYVDKEMYPLEDGDIVLIGPNQLHRDMSRVVEYIVFQFDCHQYLDPSTLTYMKLFERVNAPLSKLNYIFNENGAAKAEIARSIQDIFEEEKRKAPGYEMAVSMLIRKILLTLIRNDTRQVLPFKDHADIIRLKPVLDYVNKNISGKIVVKEASQIANISYHHFVKYFKKVIGMSFVDYVNYNKVKMAERLLLTQDLSIEEIGEKIGMTNMGHFYKIFRKFNQCSPKEFREKQLRWGRD
ncbi:HTH-type transcriptional activator RhaR [Paenibacillus solanacearum]|uniref:HTH-type transcriptional activator RhaR n=1 Tax=Paenibacillus solanacearum TaxID=2048548 RepID=A0A916NK92_9BACL|nr:AraC family transcriptional regulator [Paenibacillus solanacearum]CAG7643995.1 HTH-type transcriptional activator RhaR [Paenibacillus solanacearum]